MSKFLKGSLITAGILAALGCILCLISVLAGGRSFIYWAQKDDYIEGKLEKAGNVLSKFGWRGYDFIVDQWENENHERLIINDTDAGAVGVETQQSIVGIKNLNLTLGAGSLIIKEKEASDGMIDIYVQGRGGCDYRVKNDTFYVEGFKGIKVIGSDFSENVITLVFPAGMYFDEVDVEVGAGVMEVYDLKANEFDADVGAGKLDLRKMEVQEISADIGAGEFCGEEVSAKNADFAMSMGECIYRGTISGNLDAECDMGNMEFYLSGAEEDHNYDIECAAGNVNVGGLSFAALAAERRIDNGALGTFDISCNMGNISIVFEQ